MKRAGSVAWPAAIAAQYREAGYWRGKPLGALIWQWASQHGDRIALVDERARFSYQELAEAADSCAEALADNGMRDGDSIMVQLPNSHELVVLLLACLRLGVAPVMMLPSHREHELVNIAKHVGASAIATADEVRGYDHQSLAHRVASQVPSMSHVLIAGDKVRPDSTDLRPMITARSGATQRREHLDATGPAADDVALFLLSGGTTGLPKLIGRTHDDYEYNSRRAVEVCGFREDSVYLVALPAGHNFPLGCPGILGTLMAGGRVVMASSPAPSVVFETIARERVTDVAAVGAVLQRWSEAATESNVDLSSLRQVQVGGSIISPDVVQRAASALGCRMQQVFGMAEGLLCFTRATDDLEAVLNTQGRPMSAGDETRVVDQDDNPVQVGEIGELLTRGPYTLRGYFNSPNHNKQSFAADGWYRTGDLVRWHPSGNLIVAGRRKDVINRGGEKIAADEVEGIVDTLPQVSETAAVPVPDDVLGERSCMFVVLRNGGELSLDEVRDLFAERGVARFKTPERLEILAEMPYTAVGKIDKNALRALAVSPAVPRQRTESDPLNSPVSHTNHP